MRRRKRKINARMLATLCGAGTVFQLGGCDLGQITTTTTVDGRQAIISLVRGAILTPLDALITEAINRAFES